MYTAILISKSGEEHSFECIDPTDNNHWGVEEIIKFNVPKNYFKKDDFWERTTIVAIKILFNDELILYKKLNEKMKEFSEIFNYHFSIKNTFNINTW